MEINRPYGVSATFPSGALTQHAWQRLVYFQNQTSPYNSHLLKSLADTPNLYIPIYVELVNITFSKPKINADGRQLKFTFPKMLYTESKFNKVVQMYIPAEEMPLITSFIESMEESCQT